jgi:hypothetical protein
MIKNRKLIVFTELLIILTSTLVATSAQAAIKPGSTCKKQGQSVIEQEKKFTCIKSGKKFVWDKGKLILPPPPPKSAQSISVVMPSAAIFSTLTDTPGQISVAATSSASLPVRLSSGSPKNCSVSEFSVTPLSPGECVLIFEQEGNSQVLPAPVVQRSLLFKPDCTLSTRSTGNGSFPTATCYVGTRTIASNYLFSGFVTGNNSVYEFFGGSRIEKTTFKNSMIFDYQGGFWADKGKVQFSNLGWDGWKSTGCVRHKLDSSGAKVCEEGSGFDIAVITENSPGLRNYCFKRSATDAYCSWEFDVNWQALEPNLAQTKK